MVSSDDEAEEAPTFVTQYYFEDDKAEPISFADLPVCWSTSEAVQSSGKKIYVRGKSSDGLENLYKLVKAWKFDISGSKPEISVLYEKNWIKLQRPRKSYEEFSRKVLITVKFLHIAKRNPGLQGNDVWDRLAKVFSSFDVRPSQDDLLDHKTLIEKAIEHDDSLKKSKYLMTCLEKNLQKINIDQENPRIKGKNAFIVEDNDLEEGGSFIEKDGSVDGEDGSDDEDEGEDGIFDSVCSICDEGGSILCCDGICMRSFHATPRAAKEADSKCKSLGFSTKEVEAMQSFKCMNCQRKRHQCYCCGLLGSSDNESGTAEVFQCFNATCGYFYHPNCVAKQLHRGNEEASNALQTDIAAGEPFTCPLHMCYVCRQPAHKTDPDLRMAVCRRCPRAYHRKCLPGKIVFEDDEDEGILQRAWDNLLADRILIYCLKHEINEDLGTPLRNHIKFPGDDKKEIKPTLRRIVKRKVIKKITRPYVAPSRPGPDFESKRTLPDNPPSKTVRDISKPRGTETVRNASSEKRPVSTKAVRKSPEEPDTVKPKTTHKVSVQKSEVKLDSDSETKILKFIEEASSRITMDDVIKKQEKLISSREYKQRMDPCGSITVGKVERFCQAVRAASSTLDAGGSIEDAKAMCEPRILNQLTKWKDKLKVYLAPFIHGMRYTSFGRHFTSKEKLKEIVGKVHWYINSNDTIVDFCCGANDFSIFLKDKLESTGKTCNYKNYDLFRPRNDFNFEQRDWMKVQPKELPPGSQLIIGLNPPFGVKGRLANQFINKALEFKPKLILLIVPSMTERLDRKKPPYDLIWEDRDKLSGKAFYIPGALDRNQRQMDDWNNVPPVLYLWSRSDWTAKHKAVAKEKGHLPAVENEGCHADNPSLEQDFERFEHVTETQVDHVSPFSDEHEQLNEMALVERQTLFEDHLGETHTNSLLENKRVDRDARKRRQSEEMYTKEDIESSRENKRSRSPYNAHQGWPHRSPVNARGGSTGTLSPPSRYQTSNPNFETLDPAHAHAHAHARLDPIGYGDGRYYRGETEVKDPSLDHFEGMRSRFGNPEPQIDIHPGGRWPVDAVPQANYPLRVSPPLPEYPSQVAGEWGPDYLPSLPEYPSQRPSEWGPDYMRGGSDGHGAASQAYIEPGPRFRLSSFSGERGHGRAGAMSVMDSYGPRLDQPIHPRMSGPGHGIHNPGSQQGYRGSSMGFASRPLNPYHQSHSSTGGWIND